MKNKLVNVLEALKDNNRNRGMHTEIVWPSIPKIHKEGVPVGSVLHRTAKHLAQIIAPLAGHSEQHTNNIMFSDDYVDKIHDIEVPLNYVDDTFTLIHEYDLGSFTDHLNSIDPNIQFTSEVDKHWITPFLDTRIHGKDDSTTKAIVYRKPTHTDQYFNCTSYHHLEQKRFIALTPIRNAINLIKEDVMIITLEKLEDH